MFCFRDTLFYYFCFSGSLLCLLRFFLLILFFFFLMIRRPPRSTLDRSSAASDVYKRQGLVLGVIVVKFVVLFALAKLFRLGTDQALLLAFALPQVGEFAFVLFAFGVQVRVFGGEVAEPLVAVVAISMALTPLLMIVFERVIRPRIGVQEEPERAADAIDEHNPVIIAGFGGFGATIGRLLRANGIGVTVLDNDADRVEALEKVAKREVAPLPQPWDNERLVPVGWGRLVTDPERRTARDWNEFRVHRLLDVEESLSLRWRDLLGYEAVFDDLETALGEPLIHREARERLAWLREQVLRLAEQVDQLPGEMRRAERPARSVRKFLRTRTGERDQFFDVAHWQRRMHGQHVVRGRQQAERREVLDRIVGHVLHQIRIGRMRRIRRHHQRVAAVSYTHFRAHATVLDFVCRLLLEKKKISTQYAYTSLFHSLKKKEIKQT